MSSLLLVSSIVSEAAELLKVPKSPDDVSGEWEPGSQTDAFQYLNLLKAPPLPQKPILNKGDRLAIIGDSITEQKMYSRIIETYLTVCVPQYNVSVRQYGWSGETAAGFLRRMESDCLRFEPTLATLCYGMNDHRYRTYEYDNGRWYFDNYFKVIQKLRDAGSKVIVGAPGCIGKVPSWTNSEAYTLTQLNQNLATLRNIDVMMAEKMHLPFADVYWNMMRASHKAQNLFGKDYAVPGKDGVHPGWSGQLIMAHTFLKAMGLRGNIGTIRVQLDKESVKCSKGHELINFTDGSIKITSHRYPFCANDAIDKDSSVRSGMSLVPFNKDLNRLKLIVSGGDARTYTVTWGSVSKKYKAQQLRKGINLAEEFINNPFLPYFKKVESAVLKKQEYETRQVKQLFHGHEFKYEPDATVELTEKVRQNFVSNIKESFIPVTHVITIKPNN